MKQLLFVLLAIAPAAWAETWTLERAVATALASSPDARIAQARIDAAQAVVTQAQAAWLPQLSFSSRYTQTNSPMVAFGSILNQRAFHFGLDFNHPGRIDDLNATGTLAYNLYSGGRATAMRSAARSGADAAMHDWRATRHRLAAEVVKAALNVRKAREAVTTLERGVEALATAVRVAEARFDAGELLKADLLSLQVQLAQTREALTTTRHGAKLAERAFLFALGIESSAEPVEFADADPDLLSLHEPPSDDFSRRPELVGLQSRLDAAEAMVRAARAGRRPTVNAFANYQYNQGWRLDRHADSWLGGVALELPLFDGGQTTGRIRQAAAELQQVKEMVRQTTLAIGLEVERARLELASATERLAVSARAVEQAEESASLSRARFQQEALLSSDLLGVESRLLEAKLRHVVASADERIAIVELRRAVGLEPLTTADSSVPLPPHARSSSGASAVQH